MLLRLALFLIFCICSIICQGLLDIMVTGKNITQFTDYVKKTASLSSYFNNDKLTVFVPSDDVLQKAILPEKDKENIFLAHMYFSTVAPAFPLIKGTTANWTKYPSVKTVTGITYYTMVSLQSLYLYMYQIESAFYCNEAKLTSPDNSKDYQVYHIIDRVLTNSGGRQFFEYLSSNGDLSITAKFWQILNTYSQKGTLSPGINYKSEYLTFLQVFPGTVLVPTNDAWKKLDPNLLKSLETKEGMVQLGSIMTRHFIPNNLVFLRGEADTRFNYGFDAVLGSTGSPGLINKDMQVNIQGRTAKVVKANIPLNYGLIHLIDDSLHAAFSVGEYLTINNKAFFNKLNTVGNFSQYLSGNYTIMALDDATVNNITDPNLLRTALLNSFIVGNTPLVLGKGMVTTVGNVTIRLRLQDGDYYIDSLYSQVENTWINTAKVLSLNSAVGSTMVYSLRGYISSSPVSCDQLLQTMNSSLYLSLLSNNKVQLSEGSPYTLFVPNDVTVSNFTRSYENRTISSIMLYILRRMIIANKLVFETKGAGDFQAATMNYAAMKEMIKISITERNAVLSSYDVQQRFSFAPGGFYCYSNGPNDQSRYNLIYPVPFVLDTPLAKIPNLCVVAPCGASGPVDLGLLPLVITFLFLLVKSEILV